ncbi:hypothetical protein HYW21_06785 [Candidatus Woesearchaeota archaeon]|nr:hypothetical protein [Candidatus Woesearchaeota archaeon]
MLEQLKDKYYKFEEQIKIYNSHKSKLSNEEKYKLVEHFLSGSDFWGYSELVSTIAYDLAESSDNYIVLLEKIYEKIKRDMAQGPFLRTLEDIGKNKPGFAMPLYERIIAKSRDNDFKVISGLMLGGFSINNKEALLNRLKNKIEYPLTNSLLKAIQVKYDFSKLPKEIYSFLDKASNSQEKNVLQELTNLCLIFYKKNKTYFYSKIIELVKLKEKNITYLVFDRLTFQDILNQKQILELIEYSKDSDEVVIDKIVKVLRKFPKPYKQISDLFIYWLNRDLEFKLRHFDWVLEELVKKNKLFIKYFLENYKKIQTEKSKLYIITLPHLFKTISKHHTAYALGQVLKFDLSDKEEEYLFFELNRVIIGNIYQDINKKDIVIKQIDNLIKRTKERGFIDYNRDKYQEKKEKSVLTKDDYDFLIDIAGELLNQLRNRKEDYDFTKIENNLKKYPNLYLYAEDVIKDSKKNKQFTPLLWLGENEQPNLDDIDISDKDSELNRAVKLDFAKSRFWPQAYLGELNQDISTIEQEKNDKYKKKEHLIKNIKQNFATERYFWDYFSELIFINRFKDKGIKLIEPLPPNKSEKYLDLKVNLFKRDIYFEITRPKMDRELRLANGAVALKNKAFSTIDKKYRQLFAKKTLQEIESGKRKDLFFVVIDRSNSTIDEHQLIDSFLGSLAYTLQIEKKTGKVINKYMTRKEDSLSHKNKNTDVISGAIYFKQELIFVDKKPKIILKGDIIPNPNAKNRLKEDEMKQLKDMIFR